MNTLQSVYASSPLLKHPYMDHDNRIYLDNVKDFPEGPLPEGVIVLVGTNDQGWHGKGMAKFAKENWGIEQHEYRGILSDNVWGIPTKYHPVAQKPPALKSRSLSAIKDDIDDFIGFAKTMERSKWKGCFWVSRIGCGNAGFTPEQIGPLFKECVGMKNVLLPSDFINACKNDDPSNNFSKSHQVNEMYTVTQPLRIGIVGSSKVSMDSPQAIEAVANIISQYVNQKIILVSGGADGIDSIAEASALSLGIPTEIFVPSVKAWDGAGGFKERNLQIAKVCDKVYSIANNSNATGGTRECYHCKRVPNREFHHIKTAGCYTAYNCKESEVIVL